MGLKALFESMDEVEPKALLPELMAVGGAAAASDKDKVDEGGAAAAFDKNKADEVLNWAVAAMGATGAAVGGAAAASDKDKADEKDKTNDKMAVDEEDGAAVDADSPPPPPPRASPKDINEQALLQTFLWDRIAKYQVLLVPFPYARLSTILSTIN